MAAEDKKKMKSREHSRARVGLHRHRAWYIYSTAREIKQTFSLEELQDAVYKKTGVRPQIRRFLQETHEFSEKYEISIINRVAPEANFFTVSQDIDLDNPYYRAILCPPYERRGRPRQYAHPHRHARKYVRNYQRLMRRPERFLSKIFATKEKVSIDEISDVLPRLTEGIHFGSGIIQRVLNQYIRKARGPPFLTQPEVGVYQILR